jgi:hypothetical protein
VVQKTLCRCDDTAKRAPLVAIGIGPDDLSSVMLAAV